MDHVNLAAKLATFGDHWQPRTVARFNDCDVMVVKAQGEFVWHKHDDTDDFFLVLKGHLTIELRDRSVRLGPGELFVVPRGVEQPAGRDRGGAPPPHRARGHPQHRRRGHRRAAAGRLAERGARGAARLPGNAVGSGALTVY